MYIILFSCNLISDCFCNRGVVCAQMNLVATQIKLSSAPVNMWPHFSLSHSMYSLSHHPPITHPSPTHHLVTTIFRHCRQTGILVFGPDSNTGVAATAESLASGGVAHERFTGQEANRRYPHQLRLPDDYQCVFEEGGGILYSQRAVLAFQVICAYKYCMYCAE